MLTTSDADYIESRLIKLGEKKIDDKFKVFADWISNTFNAQILNICIDTLENKCTRIKLIFERESALAQFFIKDQFTIAYYLKTKIIKKYRALFANDQLPNTILLIDSFEHLFKTEVNNELDKKLIEKFKIKHSSLIWEVSRFSEHVTFFFYTQTQLLDATKTKFTQQLKNEYLALLKPLDKFNYFMTENLKASFDTKEKFDKYYNSSWHNYYR